MQWLLIVNKIEWKYDLVFTVYVQPAFSFNTLAQTMTTSLQKAKSVFIKWGLCERKASHRKINIYLNFT